MKKILVIFATLLILITGCGKTEDTQREINGNETKLELIDGKIYVTGEDEPFTGRMITVYGYNEYKEGLLDGESISYGEKTSSGRIIGLKRYYKMGKLHGEWIANSNTTGKLEEIRFYNMGNKDGEWKYYSDGVNISRIENWKNGVKDGEWLWYDYNGVDPKKIIKKEVYKDGVLIERIEY